MKFRFVFLVMLALFNFSNVFPVDKKPCTGPVLFISGCRLYAALLEQVDVCKRSKEILDFLDKEHADMATREVAIEKINLSHKSLMKKVEVVAADIAKQRGACAVLEGYEVGLSSGCLYHNPDNDITDEMIEILNLSYMLDQNKIK